MSKPIPLEDALALVEGKMQRGEGGLVDAGVLDVIVAAARDNFALSQQDGVGARYGVGPAGGDTAGVEAWFTQRIEAEAYARGDWSSPREIWDLVLGQRLESRLA